MEAPQMEPSLRPAPEGQSAGVRQAEGGEGRGGEGSPVRHACPRCACVRRPFTEERGGWQRIGERARAGSTQVCRAKRGQWQEGSEARRLGRLGSVRGGGFYVPRS